jgi:hypothetical protein
MDALGQTKEPETSRKEFSPRVSRSVEGGYGYGQVSTGLTAPSDEWLTFRAAFPFARHRADRQDRDRVARESQMLSQP